MNFDDLIALISLSPQVVFKPLIVCLLLFHVVFSFVLLRQVKMMMKIVEAGITPLIGIISVIHFLTSLYVLVWTVIFI